MMASKFFGRGKFALCIFVALIFCYSIPAAMASTVELITPPIAPPASLSLTLPTGFVSGTFQASQGPFNLTSVSQLRFYVSLHSGSSVTVTIFATDSKAKIIYGVLDRFTLTTNAPSASREYDTPGQYMLFSFTSSEAAAVNTAIFGLLP